jgi:hypothetical protein
MVAGKSDRSKNDSRVVPEAVTEIDSSRASKTTPLSLRAWIVGLLLIPLLVFWVEYTEIVACGPDLAAMSLPMSAVFALMILVCVNLLVRRFAPNLSLSQAELVAIYCMNSIAVYIGGIGMIQFLTASLVGWNHYATTENRWSNWFHCLKSWSLPNPNVVNEYYRGHSSFFTSEHLIGWGSAIAIWTTFLIVLVFAMYCVATLVRRQWVDHDKLVFPIVQIPLEISRNGGENVLWKNRIFWLGFGFAVVLEVIAALHFTVAPALPYFPIKPETSLQIDSHFTSRPMNAMGYTVVSFYPLVIGLSFLLALDTSFSCWFFYLATKVENVLSSALGYGGAVAGQPAPPCLGEQGVGAFACIALISLWLVRPHLKKAWRLAFLGDRSIDDSLEPMSYRSAFIGLFMSAIFLVGFGVAIGLSLFMSSFFFALFALLALTMTRIRAEAGLPWANGPWGLAHGNIVAFGGTHSETPQELVAFSQFRWFDNDWRCLAQPAELDSMKMASSVDSKPLNPRHLTLAIMAAVVVGAIAAWVSCLALYYHFGAESATMDPWRTNQGHFGYEELQNWLVMPTLPSQTRFAWAGVGAVVVTFLTIMRMRFVWWPFNPIGYAIANTDTMMWIWFPVFIGWMVKSIVFRYGGVRSYRVTLPFFFGLVLGDFAISGVLALIFLAAHMQGYRTFPN